MIELSRIIHSTGRLSELLQRSPQEIEAAAASAGIEAALRIDARLYFADADLPAIAAELAKGGDDVE